MSVKLGNEGASFFGTYIDGDMRTPEGGVSIPLFSRGQGAYFRWTSGVETNALFYYGDEVPFEYWMLKINAFLGTHGIGHLFDLTKSVLKGDDTLKAKRKLYAHNGYTLDEVLDLTVDSIQKIGSMSIDFGYNTAFNRLADFLFIVMSEDQFKELVSDRDRGSVFVSILQEGWKARIFPFIFVKKASIEVSEVVDQFFDLVVYMGKENQDVCRAMNPGAKLAKAGSPNMRSTGLAKSTWSDELKLVRLSIKDTNDWAKYHKALRKIEREAYNSFLESLMDE